MDNPNYFTSAVYVLKDLHCRRVHRRYSILDTLDSQDEVWDILREQGHLLWSVGGMRMMDSNIGYVDLCGGCNCGAFTTMTVDLKAEKVNILGEKGV